MCEPNSYVLFNYWKTVKHVLSNGLLALAFNFETLLLSLQIVYN